MEWAADYVLDESSGVRVRADRPLGHDYTDGAEAEAYILDSIRASRDVTSGSDELLGRIRDWPSEYHFSASRATLLAPFDFSGLRVLEVGCGCGALTRALGEAGARVVALEGSLERARITVARCRGLSGVEVVCDDFRDFVAPCTFDVVLMVGVLEYAPLYFGSDDGVGAALDKAGTCLADDGALIIAIENQLGLKYFAGSTEDHTGALFHGIEDRYDGRGPVTFGRAELRRRLVAAGYSDPVFYYPFPDYKLPHLIVTEAGVLEPRLHAGRLAGDLGSRDYQGPHWHLFAEDGAWEVVERNDLVRDVANSFLTVAARDAGGRWRKQPAWLAELRTTNRIRTYRTVTRFVPEGDSLAVLKSRPWKTAPEPPDSPVELAVSAHSAFLPGEPLARRVRRLLRGRLPQPAVVADALRPWMQVLRAGADTALSPDMLDAVPWNFMVGERASERDGMTPSGLFDLEWRYRRALDLDHVVYRGLTALLMSVRDDVSLPPGSTLADLAGGIAAELGVTMAADRVRELDEREVEIQSAVFGMDYCDTLQRRHDALNVPLGSFDGGGVPTTDARGRLAELARVLTERDARIALLDAAITERTQELADALAQLARVEASASWRVTAPLRRLRGR